MLLGVRSAFEVAPLVLQFAMVGHGSKGTEWHLVLSDGRAWHWGAVLGRDVGDPPEWWGMGSGAALAVLLDGDDQVVRRSTGAGWSYERSAELGELPELDQVVTDGELVDDGGRDDVGVGEAVAQVGGSPPLFAAVLALGVWHLLG